MVQFIASLQSLSKPNKIVFYREAMLRFMVRPDGGIVPSVDVGNVTSERGPIDLIGCEEGHM